MVKKLRGLAPLLVIVIGLLVLFYPTISNFLVMKNASRVVSNYDAAVEALSDEEYRSMIDAAHAYNTRLAEESSGTTSALTGAVNTEATDAEYMKLLNLAGDGMMGYVTVPKLKETLPIYHGTSEKVLQSGIGHLEQTSLPVGGASTHAALSGHRGLPTAKLFTDLNLMKKGDKFYITILKDTYAYQVDKITTVLPTDAKQLAIEPGKDLVTLITCTPYAVNTHRLLVRGHRIPYTPQQQNDAKSTFHVDIPLQYLLPSLALIALLIAWHLWQRHERRRRQSGSAKVASGDSSSTAIEPDGDSQTVQITNHIHHGEKDRADMLDLHSGSEYGAARIAAMIAAAVTIVLTVLAAFGSMVPYAQADSFGALTINAVWGRDTASPKSLAGDTYAIVRVATVTTNNDGSVSSYKTVSDFSGLTADWERLTSSEYHDAAKKLAAHAAKNKLYQHSGTTNAAGQLTFQNLPLGLYLVSRTDSAKANKAYDCDPFLISIPGSGDTAADLNITVEPKFSTSTPPTPPEHEHNPGEMPGNPGVIGNTGAAVGGIAGLKLRVRYRSDDTESSHQFRADGGKA